MRYAQLRAFHHVAIHNGFSKAASALGLTQPAISDQVRKLEIEYDVRLFSRIKKQVTLTKEGNELLEITHRLFEVEQSAQELLSESKAEQTGTLKIIADSARHILNTLGAFKTRHPGIQISVSVGNSDEIPVQLQSYNADIGVIGELPKSTDFEFINLGTTNIIAFTKAGTGLKNAMTIRELTGSTLVMREPGSRTRTKFEQQAKQMGIKTTTHIEAEGREAVREIVAGGGGIGIIAEAEFTEDPRLQKITISDTTIHMDEALICLRERRDSKLIRPFMKLARETLVINPNNKKILS